MTADVTPYRENPPAPPETPSPATGGRAHVRHQFTLGRFTPDRCQVRLSRYPCPYPEDEHEPGPPEDVDVFGRRRHGRGC